MPQYADNNVYLSIDGVVVSAYFKSVSLNPTNAEQDTTMGAGTDHMQRAAGLNDTSITITLGYDTAQVQTQIAHLKPGVIVPIEYGKEGNTSGKPRHVQNFLITGNTVADDVAKTPSTFEITGSGADAPSVDMFSGATYS